MDQVNRDKIVQALYDKGVRNPCPRCSSLNFEVVGQNLLSLNEPFRSAEMGGRAVPTAIVACSNCGFITLHALVSLNLMSKSNESD